MNISLKIKSMKLMALVSTCLVYFCAMGFTAEIDDREASQLLEIRLRWDEGQSKETRKSDLAIVQRAMAASAKNRAFAIGIFATLARYDGLTEEIGNRIKAVVYDENGFLCLEQFDCCIEFARSVAKKRDFEAQDILTQVGNLNSILPKLLAAEAYGDILCTSGRFRAGNELYILGIEFYNADQYAKADKRSEATVNRLKKKSIEMARLIDIEKYGEEFVIFREAVEQHRNKNYITALEKYNDLSVRYPASIFGMASNCFAGSCLLSMGKVKVAVARWREITKNKFGIYTGEAFLNIGDAFLFEDEDFASALSAYKEAENWTKEIVSCGVNFKDMKIPERCSLVAQPPSKIISRDQWGNIKRSDQLCGQVVNHLTADWYLSDLKMRALSGKGFVFFYLGKKEEAITAFSDYSDVDQVGQAAENLGKGNFSVRMIWNIMNNEGCLRAYPEEAAVFTDPRRRIYIFMADYLFEKENYDMAKIKYEQIKAGAFGKPALAEQAYLMVATAQCDSRLGDYEMASNTYKLFTQNKWIGTPSAPRALMYLAGTINGRSSNGEEPIIEAVKVYDTVVRTFPRTLYADDACFFSGLAYLYANDEKLHKAGIQRLRQYPKLFPNGVHKKQATDDEIERRIAEYNSSR